jgi:predicted nucleic acid-binding protein
MILVLDSDAVDTLAAQSPRLQRVKAAMRAAVESGADVVVPTVVLAELYRSSSHNAAINSMLSREHSDLQLRDTDRTLASFVGGILASASAGSEDIVDAHCVAAVVERGRGVILTGDPDGLTRLAAAYPTVTVRRT